MRNETSNLVISLRRTIVPIIVGWLLAQGIRYGFDIPADALTGVIEALVMGVYYTVLRVVEMFIPSAGIMLGAMKRPQY